MADRLAQKLAKFIHDFAVPPHVQEKIREELHWSSLSASKKYQSLMELKHYSSIEFRRMMDVLKELVTQREIDSATALASHYFEFLDEKGTPIEITELSRAPELIRTIPLAHLGFAAKTAERLGRTLQREDLPEFIHGQAASALTVLAQSIVAFEDFQDVLTVGLSLESSQNRDPEKHKKCCGVALSRLLPAAAIERIIELFLQQRNDSAWAKTAGSLLRFAAPASIESVFNHLIAENEARNRLALLRLATQLGRGTIDVAVQYLADERWYVVRNMCGVLADLKDPDLPSHLLPVLQHSDARVQQAALKALLKSRSPERGPVMAASLAKMAPSTLDEALDELMFLRDAGTLAGLEEFVGSPHANTSAARKAAQVLATIPGEATLHALARLMGISGLDSAIRQLAMGFICKDQTRVARELLEEIAKNNGPAAQEARTELKKRETKPQA
jgi:HEAT repeat protein